MRLLINGRQQQGPAAYVVGLLVLLVVIALLVFVVLPILGVVAVVGAGAGLLVLAARALGIGRRRRGASIDESGETDYRIESSRPLDTDDRILP